MYYKLKTKLQNIFLGRDTEMKEWVEAGRKRDHDPFFLYLAHC